MSKIPTADLRITNSKLYNEIHSFIRKNYGKATCCSFQNCNGKSKTFDWALKQGCEYKKDIK